MLPAFEPPHRTLLLYRDPALLPVIDRRGVLPTRPGLVIELAPQSRLRRDAGQQPVSPKRPIVHASIRRHGLATVLAAVERSARRVHGGVIFICHVDDAPGIVDHMDGIDDVRLVWHPASPLNRAARSLLERLCEGPLRAALDESAVIVWDPPAGEPVPCSERFALSTVPAAPPIDLFECDVAQPAPAHRRLESA